jgi:hypothetical protein
VDLGELGPAPFRLGCPNIGTALAHGRGPSARIDQCLALADLFGVIAHAHARAQRVQPFLERVQLALRVGEHQRHVGVGVGQLTHPALHHRRGRVSPD